MSQQRLGGNSTECPYCGANLVGAEIPKQYREHYGCATHYLRVIGIEQAGDDYISSWKCPDCGKVEGAR